MYNDEALWRSFVVKLLLAATVMDDVNHSLRSSNAGTAFVNQVDNLKKNMDELKAVDVLDENSDFNIFENSDDDESGYYDEDRDNNDLYDFKKYGLKEVE